MIDLHLHTTASDGTSTPTALVAEAAGAGVEIFAVTDHDTVAAIQAATAAAAAAGLTCIPGIEITAVHGGRDVHMLGYFFDPDNPDLARFLDEQRADRRRRVTEMAVRLEELGVPIDVAPLLATARRTSGKAVGRPGVAQALVSAGHARDIGDAFDRYLGHGRPAFVERQGATPAEVVQIIAGAGGLSSLAHPGRTKLDEIIPELAASGLSALEVFHPDHLPADSARYAALAATHGLLTTGGSDYHGKHNPRSAHIGNKGITRAMFDRLAAAAAAARPA
ncbi:MAG: PHP domain-containing protein [Acidobacteriota bacterium]